MGKDVMNEMISTYKGGSKVSKKTEIAHFARDHLPEWPPTAAVQADEYYKKM